MTPPKPPAPDPNRFIASLARDQVTLDLKTVDLCFIAGLYLRADKASLASFEEDVLIDLFEQVCDVVEPGAENPRKRATHAIQRLRDQRMLARVDGGGIVRAGEYTLTRLAAAVVEYFLSDEALTRESLTLLTRTLGAQLAAILGAAKKAEGEAAWRAEVVAPLSVTVSDLVSGIERRQRGLDVQQEEVQAEIAKLLSADWFKAVDQCQALLDATTSTLRELNEILLRDTHQFVALLQEIQTLAGAAENSEAEGAVQRVIEHVDRIAAWGAARQRAWSEYYQYVHRYLRDVVRLDPNRALSQRVRDQIVAWPKRPFHLLTPNAPSIRLLRPLEVREERPPVARARADRELALEWVEPENVLAGIEALVERALEDGASRRHIGRDDGTAYDYLVDAQAEFEGTLRAVLLVENLGAFCDLPSLDGWLFAHVAGWDTATARRLLERLRHVPVVHFGDLDPNGVRIFQHLRRARADLRWFIPAFWQEAIESEDGLVRSWPDDLDLRDAPELVQQLARAGLWLEQEPVAVDPRTPAALEAMLCGSDRESPVHS